MMARFLSSSLSDTLIKAPFPLFVTNQMQLEAKEPSHGTLASLRNAPEHLVDMYPLVPAHSKGSAVHETYACTFPKQYLLDEQSQRYGNFLFKFHETVV